MTTEATPVTDLASSTLYFNRELSWLEFNARVLELAEDERQPLLERVKFAAIYTSNCPRWRQQRPSTPTTKPAPTSAAVATLGASVCFR